MDHNGLITKTQKIKELYFNIMKIAKFSFDVINVKTNMYN